MEQPFNNYKNKGVEYDYILSASVNVGTIDNIVPAIIQLLNNEDLLKMYFDKISLGRVYGKVEYINDKLQFTFGISLVDAEERPTTKEILQNIKDFILSLNKNIEDTELNIKESDIKMDIINENKINIDNIDKTLVNESVVSFNRNNDVQSLTLTSDGIIERYSNGTLSGTFPFSKLGVVRECKSLLADGYTLVWTDRGTGNLQEATITNPHNNDNLNISLDDDPEQIKKDLQQNIQDVEEIQNLKDELEDKIDTLNEDNKIDDEYALVIYKRTANDTYDLISYVKKVEDETFIVTESMEEAATFNKKDAKRFADKFTQFNFLSVGEVMKAVKLKDLPNLISSYSYKDFSITESVEPNTDYVLVIYTNINGDFVPDVCVREINGDNYVIADDIDDAGRYSKEEADKIVDMYNSFKENAKKHILKAVKFKDIDTLQGLYENKKIQEDNEDDITDYFPSSDATQKELNKTELSELKLYDILSVEQINWLQDNIGTIEEIASSLKDMLNNIDDSFDEDETILSVDKYVENLQIALKGE